ncbi:MAG: CPBP family intramembrane metalloprotease [Acidimicrobiia bacterium]|nr:CPBP family intramembrane metalloprotease [Acidimicrobiia bacterium]
MVARATTSHESPTPQRSRTALTVVVGLLVAWNLVGNLAVPDAWYVPTNLAVAGALVAVAWWAGLRAREVGLSRGTVTQGVRWGGVVAAAVLVVVALGTLVPFAADAYTDERVDVDGAGLAFYALVRIPFGTVVLEEVAFRGILLALLVRVLAGRPTRVDVTDPGSTTPTAPHDTTDEDPTAGGLARARRWLGLRRLTRRWEPGDEAQAAHPSEALGDAAGSASPAVLWQATWVSSVLFGLWHIVPSIPAARGNVYVGATVEDPLGLVAIVAAAVATTTVAGLVFCWLRLRSGSLLAPMIAHVATNSGSFTVAWLLAS